MRMQFIVGAVVIGGGMFHALPASAQVRDAVYRGTLVCAKLPFLPAAREAIEVRIAGGKASYTHIVRHQKDIFTESGAGVVVGQEIRLEGRFAGSGDTYQAKYGGRFVRRSAQVTGTQAWSHGGKSYTRNCSGSIKRPFAVFLRGEKSPVLVDDD